MNFFVLSGEGLWIIKWFYTGKKDNINLKKNLNIWELKLVLKTEKRVVEGLVTQKGGTETALKFFFYLG